MVHGIEIEVEIEGIGIEIEIGIDHQEIDQDLVVEAGIKGRLSLHFCPLFCLIYLVV